jgi:hypothetical protein
MRTLPAKDLKVAFPVEEELPSFNLVMLYDHELAAKGAQRSIAALLGRCLPETDTHQDSWRFEDLAHAQFRKEASELARACDLMVLVTLNENQVPFEVSSWIEHWTCNRNKKDAALVLLRVSADESMPASMFEPPFGLPASPSLAVFTSALGLAATSRPTRSPSDLCYEPRPDGWGINE